MKDTEYVNIWMRPERPARGPRPAYSRDQITEAAVRIADAEGIEAASMRKIAADIGAGAMSLYRYVPSRDDLIELMVDRVYGEMDLPAGPTGDWRADLETMAREYRAMQLRHSWLHTVQRGTPMYGPEQLRVTEFGLGALDVGISIDEMLSLVGLLNGYVDNFTRAEVMWLDLARRTGLTQDDWMRRNAGYVHQIMRSGDHPIFTRVVMDAQQPHMTDEESFDYGLERVLNAIGATLAPTLGLTPSVRALENEESAAEA
ncbi:TetR/AcrR family transcriptional regulator [Actinomadura barringtoniae]|uniref:TetR/AcrR family transcriptional regulator n=1 Tax=Actinomadura barringtoniae TaxID=1427535 RepID=A0A939PM76_9ACTN|nr:TetR/AcrR family transcriptional regulator [Actinomadura barringtoniae]MBO2454648.1 TetR/AcrR family transcriptional regulator [Actinomadura barringtoniae]